MPNPALTSRPVQPDDMPAICGFPTSLEEVSFMFRNPVFPMPQQMLEAAIKQREASTVVLLHGAVAGFANFYDCKFGESCAIGNVIIDHKQRGKGIARFLVETMAGIARTDYQAKRLNLVCFNRNIGGLLLYTKMGFTPYAIEERQDPEGARIAAIRMSWSI